ncbi:DUF5979 domain-containing protein [Demequina sp. NBRC 110056]|uniref:DUF5979 domain-containing protein n=1 Tax=Demequina sp. NBRC 110056 TaxID=1570345 RepID=UPI000A053976|nr:DUF5979 domain-containing protein [Demequina sp. NBRC 110056]
MNALARVTRGTAGLAVAIVARIIAVVALAAIALLAFGLAALPASAAESVGAGSEPVSSAPAPEPGAQEPVAVATAEPAAAPSVAPTAQPAADASDSSAPAPAAAVVEDDQPAGTAPDPAPAPAAPTAIDALSNVHASVSDVADGKQLRIDAGWALPAGTAPGSTFGLSLPAELVAAPIAPFPLLDTAGQPVGDCEVTRGGIECTAGDYVAHHQDVHGTLWFKVTAHYTDGASHVDLVEAGGATHRIDLTVQQPTPTQPHTGATHAYHPAAQPTKRSRRVDSTRRRIDWEVTVPTAARPSHGPLTVTDTWSGSTPLSLTGDAKLTCKAQPSGHTSAVAARGYAVTERADGVTVSITDSSCDGTYVLDYSTQIPATATGRATYGNVAVVPGAHRATAHATWNPPAALSKSVKGDNANRRASWTVVADAASLGSGEAVISDHYSDRLTLDPDSVSLQCRVLGRTQHLSGSAWTASGSDPSSQLLEVSVTDQTCRVDGGQYVLTYTTAYPRDAFSGEAYSNTVDIGSVTTTKDVTYTASAGGAATGVALWALHVTKDVTGPGEAQVGDTPFDVTWSYGSGADAKNGVLHVHDGSSATLARIPEGQTVTLTEAANDVDGVVFTAPVYTGHGVNAAGARSATVSGGKGTVEVRLENPTAAVPPLAPVLAPHQAPHQVPTPTPVAVPPMVPQVLNAPHQVPGLVPTPTPVAVPPMVPQVLNAPHQVPGLVPTPTPVAVPPMVPQVLNAPHQVPGQVPTPTPVAVPPMVPQVLNAPHQVPGQVPTPTPVAVPPMVPGKVTTTTVAHSTPRAPQPTVQHPTAQHPATQAPTPHHPVAGRTHLSHTGADSLAWGAAAAGLVAVGGVLAVAGRRRRVRES